MALANDAVIRDGACIGDPTEGALVVLAAKGGLDVDETRRYYPRVAEVPFDAEYKLMATFHEMDDDGTAVVRCFVKGAPDVLLARSSRYMAVDGSSAPMTDENRERVLSENDRLAGEGLRVLAVARRDFDPACLRSCGRSPRARERPRARGADRHRRSAAQGGEGRDRALPRRGHPGPDDHRRPRDDRIGHRAAARHRRPSAHGSGVRGDARRAASRRSRRHRRRRPRRAGRQGPPRQHPQAPGEHRRDDRRRRERRAGPHSSRHRRGHGHHGDRGHQGRRRDDPDRRQLRHDRGGGRGWAGSLRQLDEVHPRPDDHAGRLHPHLRRRRHLRHRERLAASPIADPLDQLRGRRASCARPRFRRAVAGAHEPASSITGGAGDRTGPRRSARFRGSAGGDRHPGRRGVGRGSSRSRGRDHHGFDHHVAPPHRGIPRVARSASTASSAAAPSPTGASTS